MSVYHGLQLGTYTAYYVYRDGVPIARVTGKSYTDILAAGDCEYQIRGILATGYYTLSNKALQAVTLLFDIISPVERIFMAAIKIFARFAVSPRYGENDSVSYLYFAGREYPVPWRGSGHGSRQGKFAVCV